MLLILFISQASLNGIMAFKIIFSISLMGAVIFLNIFDSEENKSNEVNSSDSEFKK